MVTIRLFTSDYIIKEFDMTLYFIGNIFFWFEKILRRYCRFPNGIAGRQWFKISCRHSLSLQRNIFHRDDTLILMDVILKRHIKETQQSTLKFFLGILRKLFEVQRDSELRLGNTSKTKISRGKSNV